MLLVVLRFVPLLPYRFCVGFDQRFIYKVVAHAAFHSTLLLSSVQAKLGSCRCGWNAPSFCHPFSLRQCHLGIKRAPLILSPGL